MAGQPMNEALPSTTLRRYYDEASWVAEFVPRGDQVTISLFDTRDDRLIGSQESQGADESSWDHIAHILIDGRIEPSLDDHLARVPGLCEQLKGDPIFHMSLNSKELFHSNLLAWFFDKYPLAARFVCARWADAQAGASWRPTEREYKKLDLIIQPEGLSPLVVENKVLSLPDIDQLDDYAATKLDGLDDPCLLLLSLVAPGWTGGHHTTPSGHTWRYVSYLELADALDESMALVQESSGNDAEFDLALMDRYIQMIRTLHQLIRTVSATKPIDPLNLDQQIQEELAGIKLDSVVGKQRAFFAAQHARAMSPRVVDASAFTFGARLTRTFPLVEGFVGFPNGDHLGWQYQEQKFRLAVKVGDESLRGTSEATRAARHRYVAENYSWWFDFDPLIREVPEVAESPVPEKEMIGEFYRFDPGFVYRYRRWDHPSASQLAEVSASYLALLEARLLSSEASR